MPSRPPPTSGPDLFRLATAYLSRRAASTAQLRRYLTRKAGDRRGDHDDPEVQRPDRSQAIEDALARVQRAGLLDDPGLARARASLLTRRGFPTTRVRGELRRQGLDLEGEALESVRDLEDEAQARRFAERKRLGPFASGRRAASFDRDVRALVRAGFSPNLAVRVMTALMREALPSFNDPPTSNR